MHPLDQVRDKKVAVYLNSASASPTIELHASICRELIARNNEVTVYYPDRSFKSPTENPFNSRAISRYSLFRAKDAVRGLSLKFQLLNLDQSSQDVPESVGEALEIGVMSSIASATKVENKSQLNKSWSKVYDNMFISARKLFNKIVNEIQKEKYDFVLMYNGRFGCVKPVLEAARYTSTRFGLYETKSSLREIVFIDELVHSIDGNTRKAISCYEEDKELAEKTAKVFFERKEQNKYAGDKVYTKDQLKGLLPKAVVETKKKIVAIYPSTDDEFKYIGKEWDGHVPEDQVEEIKQLAQNLDGSEYLVVVKMHPNQVNSPRENINRYLALGDTFKHVIVEPPLSKKDSYALMHKANFIVTLASTMGVEACYAGKTVILVGDTIFSKMNIGHRASSGLEAAKLIQGNIEPKPKTGAIMWGNYLYSYKDELKDFERKGNGDYYVRGKKIGESFIRRVLQIPAKLKIEMSKPGFRFGKGFLLKIKHVGKNILTGKSAVQGKTHFK